MYIEDFEVLVQSRLSWSGWKCTDVCGQRKQSIQKGLSSTITSEQIRQDVSAICSEVGSNYRLFLKLFMISSSDIPE